MGAKEKANVLHARGYNCAQSVLGALDKYTGLEEITALSVACGFGGGVSCGEICGAAAGAVMAIGLTFAGNNPEDPSVRAGVRKLSGEFNRKFQENFGCIRCLDLKRSGQPCPALIEYAAEAAEKLIQNNLDKGE